MIQDLFINYFVVNNLPYVFPKELPGLPPKRDIEFTIDLILNIDLIFFTPYRLAPIELKS